MTQIFFLCYNWLKWVKVNMNERQAKKQRKKEEEIKNNALMKEISEATKEDVKKKEELLKILEKNRVNLEKLQKDYNDNLDKDLMPIDVVKFKEIAEDIKKIDAEQRKLKIQVKELEKEISEKIIKISDSEESTLELPVEEIKDEFNNQNSEVLEVYDESEEPTLELPTKEIKNAVESFENESSVKIEFDLKNGLYRIYSPYSESPIIHVVSKELLDSNSEEYKKYTDELKQKYGENINLDDLDLNVAKAFEKFDKSYNTNIENKYVKSTFNGKIVYDFRKFKRANKNIVNNDFLNSKQKRKLKNIAKNYTKKFDNCDIIQFSNKKAAMLLGGALVMGAAATAGVTAVKSNEDKKNVVEYVDGMPVDSDEEDIIYYDDNGNEILKDSTSSSTTEIETHDNIKNEQVTGESDFDNPDKKEIIDEDEHKEFRVGTIIDAKDMENIDLYRESTSPEPVGNTERWNFGGYMVDAIAITDGNTIINVVRDNKLSVEDLIKECENSYGPGFNVSLHFEGLDENGNIINEKLGWVRYDDLVQDNKNVKTK